MQRDFLDEAGISLFTKSTCGTATVCLPTTRAIGGMKGENLTLLLLFFLTT